MQLYALDATGSPVPALRALRGCSYVCPECRGPLRMRQGPCKQPHFYHLSASKTCSLSHKSLEHLHTQLRLLALIEGGALEVPFTTIQRIADVAWPSRKWVFEVQCSPISLEEVQARCADYARLGYAVLWILHERCFNQRKVGAAEQLLRAQGCYFTNMSAQGRGVFYDQFEVVEGRKRRHRGPPLEVNPTQLTKLPQQNKELPSCLASRTWRAEGDLWDRILRGEHPEEQLKRLLDSQQRKGKPLSLLTLIKQSCCALGRAWLRACSN